MLTTYPNRKEVSNETEIDLKQKTVSSEPKKFSLKKNYIYILHDLGMREGPSKILTAIRCTGVCVSRHKEPCQRPLKPSENRTSDRCPVSRQGGRQACRTDYCLSGAECLQKIKSVQQSGRLAPLGIMGGPSQRYGIERFKGGPQFVPNYAERPHPLRRLHATL